MDDPACEQPSRWRRRQVALLGAAAAGVVAAAANVIVAGPPRPSAAVTVDTAVAASSQALERLGRVEISKRIAYETDPTVIEAPADAVEVPSDSCADIPGS